MPLRPLHILLPLTALVLGTLPPSAALALPKACESHTPAAIGGPVPGKDDDTVVVRWLATANYEISYRGQVFLFDTYYNRKARSAPIGFTAEQVKKADAIFIGHAHFDHISDVAPVARQTNAPVVGAPITIETAVKLGVPANKTMTVKGGETLKFGDVTVDVALAHHSAPPKGLGKVMTQLFKLELRPDTPDEAALTKAVRARGSSSPDVRDKGTIAYGLTFPNGFKVLVLDSAGPVTEGDRELAKKLGRADIAIIAYQANPVAEAQIAATYPLIKLFNPRLYLPAHHDGSIWHGIDVGLSPLFTKLRDEMPGTAFLAPLYRSPICVATSGPDRGKVVSFHY
jgi:L-ascorbate metabolism protein UlaG (beta-lactamase superfamily)